MPEMVLAAWLDPELIATHVPVGGIPSLVDMDTRINLNMETLRAIGGVTD